MPGGAALTGPTTVSQPVGPVRGGGAAGPPGFHPPCGPEPRSATGLFSGKKKPTLRLAQSMNTILFRVVRVVVFAAIAFSAVTVQVQAVVGQADAMTGGDFTLA